MKKIYLSGKSFFISSALVSDSLICLAKVTDRTPTSHAQMLALSMTNVHSLMNHPAAGAGIQVNNEVYRRPYVQRGSGTPELGGLISFSPRDPASRYSQSYQGSIIAAGQLSQSAGDSDWGWELGLGVGRGISDGVQYTHDNIVDKSVYI